MDEFVKFLVDQFLSYQSDWLSCSLKKVKFISDMGKGSVRRGFEWLVKIGLGYYLLKNQRSLRIEEIKVDQQCGKVRPDILFIRKEETVVMELKTVGSLQEERTWEDIGKNFPPGCIAYFLIFSYPGENEAVPPDGIVSVHSGSVGEGFKFYLYRKP